MSMKRVSVFQTATREDFSINMHAAYGAGSFVDLSKMEEVLMLRYPSEDKDEDILEDVFCRLNDEEYKYCINYSLSVGDVVRINDKAYRCMSCDWELIQ